MRPRTKWLIGAGVVGVLLLQAFVRDRLRKHRAEFTPAGAAAVTRSAITPPAVATTTLRTEGWPACPTFRMHPGTPPYLFSEWIPPSMAEPMRETPDIIRTTRGPALVSSWNDEQWNFLGFEVDRFDAAGTPAGQKDTISIRDWPENIREVGGTYGVAADGDTMGAVVKAGKTFAFATIDLRTMKTRAARAIDFAWPEPVSINFQPRVIAGSGRFGAVVPFARSAVWLEFDEAGSLVRKPMKVQNDEAPEPFGVWNGQGFAFVSRRRENGILWTGITVPDRTGPRFLRAASHAPGQVIVEGQLLWHQSAYVFGMRSLVKARSRFELVRVSPAGTVDRLECPDT